MTVLSGNRILRHGKPRLFSMAGLHVRAGIELGQPMQNIEAAEDILDACDFDFALASVHNVQGMPDFYELDYSQVDLTKTLHQYFDEILETIEWGKFDSLAHLTYPWRYIVGEHGLAIRRRAVIVGGLTRS